MTTTKSKTKIKTKIKTCHAPHPRRKLLCHLPVGHEGDHEAIDRKYNRVAWKPKVATSRPSVKKKSV